MGEYFLLKFLKIWIGFFMIMNLGLVFKIDWLFITLKFLWGANSFTYVGKKRPTRYIHSSSSSLTMDCCKYQIGRGFSGIMVYVQLIYILPTYFTIPHFCFQFLNTLLALVNYYSNLHLCMDCQQGCFKDFNY